MKHQTRCAGLPLAVYREVAAHLLQVDGVAAGLISQQSRQFNYNLSQVDSLWIEYADHASSTCYQQVQQILAYYGDLYGAWEEVNPQSTTV